VEKRADLHVHTTYSDGSLTPQQVIEQASKVGLGCVGICDHDSINGLSEAISVGSSCGVEVIPGVEVSAEENGKELHILGYFIDYENSHLTDMLKQIRDDRKNRAHNIIKALNRHGFDIDAEDVMSFVGDVSLSRLHIAQYMESRKLIPCWRDAFDHYIGDGKPCYIANFRLCAKEAIDLITSASGIPVIAHPGVNGADDFLPSLIKQGIRGIEAYHPEQSSSMSSYYVKYAKEENLLVTGGSDCHGTVKGNLLMGTVTVSYSRVQDLKDARP